MPYEVVFCMPPNTGNTKETVELVSNDMNEEVEKAVRKFINCIQFKNKKKA